MDYLKINVGTSGYSGSGQNYFPIVLFGKSELDSGYDSITGLSFSGGGGVSVTTKDIDAVSSFSSVAQQMPRTGSSGGATSSTFVETLSTADTEVYKLRAGDVSETGSDATPANFEAPDYNKHIATGDNEITEVATVSLSGSFRTPSTISGWGYVTNVARNLVTSTETVVTGVTGGGGSAFSPDITYDFDGDEVEITGDGYKKKITDTSTKPIKVKFIRFFVNGTDGDFEPADVFAQESFILTTRGNKTSRNPISLIQYFRPENVKGNIIDIPLDRDINQDEAIVLGALKSATVTYKIAVFYED